MADARRALARALSTYQRLGMTAEVALTHERLRALRDRPS